MRAFAVLLLLSTFAFAGEKGRLVFEMFLEQKPFSFETLFGSPEAYAAIAAAEKIEAYRIHPRDPVGKGPAMYGSKILGGPVEITGDQKNELRRLLLTPDSFIDPPACVPNSARSCA